MRCAPLSLVVAEAAVGSVVLDRLPVDVVIAVVEPAFEMGPVAFGEVHEAGSPVGVPARMASASR
ncbi:hypothetical protein [Nocardia vaccinii]|uniref:hypothetical protein n=1 Tax=Nocardia vaccinii TaxID=1822 RepID=UPI0012F4A043|nr:hypothetical protein [Nocardia vaccinii]